MALGSTQPLTETSTSNIFLGLTILPPSCAECLEIWELQPPGTLRAYPGMYRDCFTSIENTTGCHTPRLRLGSVHLLQCSFFNFSEKIYMHWNVNTIHKLLYVSALLESHHQVVFVSVKVVPFELVRDCLSILFPFQCIKGWLDKMYFASCTVRTILKTKVNFLLRYFLQIAASLITYTNKLQILQYKCNFFHKNSQFEFDVCDEVCTRHFIVKMWTDFIILDLH